MANINGQVTQFNNIEVLDKGYVRLEAITGKDLSSVNSAKVSFDKKATEFTDKERRLIKYLASHGHTSPFRHAFVTFECYAPLMVARQWWKYIIGSGHEEIEKGMQDPFTAWNESSRRYITEKPEFYIPAPEEWRGVPKDKKQGSGGMVPLEVGSVATDNLIKYQKIGLTLYEQAMEKGICAEQARLFLPAYGLYVRWYWSASVQGVAHMLNQRLAHDSQAEFQEYAKAVYEVLLENFPVSADELVKLAEEAGA
ncbi:thymidylate synthase (FAD) [Priestia megaterium]|uniref:FAD-dependent thymidylate synthase n=1 Tax=Priestia megaterium TaxID=1404 RepID=UPI000BF4DD6F|nr:FAD-dependent thymidylate synthase [Priestia megaterium]PEZ47059.1 thymidylate synthase (FAD) [Priestia megaterium]